jgi:hypothetical protein
MWRRVPSTALSIVCSAAAFCAGGCGGGGDSTPTAPAAPPSPGMLVLEGAEPATDAEIVEGFIAGQLRIVEIAGGVDTYREAIAAKAELTNVIDRMLVLHQRFYELPHDRQGELLDRYENELTWSGMAIAGVMVDCALRPALASLIEEIRRVPPLV